MNSKHLISASQKLPQETKLKFAIPIEFINCDEDIDEQYHNLLNELLRHILEASTTEQWKSAVVLSDFLEQNPGPEEQELFQQLIDELSLFDSELSFIELSNHIISPQVNDLEKVALILELI
jgi:hypothetical protein